MSIRDNSCSELYRFAVLNKHADFTKALPWMRDVAAEVMRRCQCRCNSFRTVQCPSSATAVECLGGRGILVYRSFLAHILEFYLVAVLDENLWNVGVVAVTAAADAGRAAVGRHDDPIL